MHEDQRSIKGVLGDMVYSCKQFDVFWVWIEDRISNERKINFLNVSDGSHISGMTNISCEKYLNGL